jgi:FkbM family methyltransferase
VKCVQETIDEEFWNDKQRQRAENNDSARSYFRHLRQSTAMRFVTHHHSAFDSAASQGLRAIAALFKPGAVDLVSMASNSPRMLPNTRVLFTAILQRAGADLICDIGSRDGEDALRLRSLFPAARLFAFEANHYNFDRMAADARLQDARVELFSCAISGADGEARFHISDVDYSDERANRGTSSLLSGGNVEVKETAIVQTRRLDRFVLEKYPDAKVIGLWIDVEGAEYEVLSGIGGIKERIAVIHVETAITPFREGQRTTNELTDLLETLGFEPAAIGFEQKHGWGDAVYIRKSVREALGWRFRLFRWKSKASAALGVGHIAVFLRDRFPRLYRSVYRMYHRLGS